MELKDMVDIDKIFNKKVKRGEVYYIKQTGLEIGSETKKTRPGVIVSNDRINLCNGNAVEVAYLTSNTSKSHLSGHVNVCHGKSCVLCDAITTVDRRRIGDYIKTLTKADMEAVDAGIVDAFGLNVADGVDSSRGSVDISRNEGGDVETKFVNLNITAFEPGEDETLIRAAEIIREINELGMRVNEIQKIIDSEDTRTSSELEKVLPVEKIEEIRLLTMKKIEDQRLIIVNQLKEIIRRIDSRVDISCVVSLDGGSSGSGDSVEDSRVDSRVDSRADSHVGLSDTLVNEGDRELVIEKKTSQNRLSKEQLAKVKEMLIDGYDTWRIVAVVGCTNKQVYDHRRSLRKKGLIE